MPDEEKALGLKRKHAPDDRNGIVKSLENLATCYEKTDRNAEAKLLREEVTKLKGEKEGER